MRTHSILNVAPSLALAVASSGTALAQGYDPAPKAEEKYIEFKLDRSAGIVRDACLPYAAGKVRVTSRGPVEVMDVELEGLPANIELDAFVIQVPNAPFGMSWYQGDIESDEYGHAKARFVGRFNVETFIVAPGTAPAPQVHHEPIADAAENPATAPVHTYHIGIWFNSPDDAKAAGCSDIVTPFNGEHNAGVQLFNTASFPDQAGPLSLLE
ncbi:MAG TPA: hypothetical protein VFN67_42425 [Polyangiales bacterium]|nr:hypothetical protein [Polyangiales bacterium]